MSLCSRCASPSKIGSIWWDGGVPKGGAFLPKVFLFSEVVVGCCLVADQSTSGTGLWAFPLLILGREILSPCLAMRNSPTFRGVITSTDYPFFRSGSASGFPLTRVPLVLPSFRTSKDTNGD